MTFNETISVLLDETESIIVYAAQAYNYVNGRNVPSIGIRSFFAGYDNNDPVIDGVPFMVCGTARDRMSREMTDIRDLEEAQAQNCYVNLHAVSSYQTVTVDLGTYHVGCKSGIDENGTITMHLDRMQ